MIEIGSSDAIPPHAIVWLAGLLEGEAWFGWRKTPCIELGMCDRDVVLRAARLMRAHVYVRLPSNRRRLAHFRFVVTGRSGAGWMMTLYQLMGLRRRAQISRALECWRRAPRQNRD